MVNLLPRDGELRYVPGFIAPPEAERLFLRLLEEIPWRDEITTDAGATVRLPRAVCWYGNSAYPYAGFTHYPLPWTETLLRIKQRVEAACHENFNGMLGNLYRAGCEGMGWHADREAVLGMNPLIASLSLGAERLMGFRHERTGEERELRLEAGSLLIMEGSLQHHWLHRIPEMPEAESVRINLNFRRLHAGRPRGEPLPDHSRSRD